MATFVANNAVDMNKIAQDLETLEAIGTTWTNGVATFTVAGTGHNTIQGSGGPFLPLDKPTSGNLDSLTVTYEYPSEKPGYTLSGLGTTLEGLLLNIGVGTTFAVMSLLNGSDTITGSDHADQLLGFAGGDALHGGKGDDHLDGGAGNDHLFGDVGDDDLAGGGDDDVLVGGPGYDHLDGGPGNDTADYSAAHTSVVVKLAGATAVYVKVGGQIADVVKNIESIQGGHAADHLTGDGQKNKLFGNGGNDVIKGGGAHDDLYGGAGKDTISGGDGGDVLFGGRGNDILRGGAGVDAFVFDTALNAKSNVDTIKDFSLVDDFLVLSRSVFAAITDTDIANHDYFAKGAAHDANDHIIYRPGNGDLLYDADGNGHGHAVLFAHLAKHLDLTVYDFSV